MYRLAPFADTPEGVGFGKKLWVEVLAECKSVNANVSKIWGDN